MKQGVIQLNNENVSDDVNGSTGFGVNISGTWVGTLQFEGSVDNQTFVALPVIPIAGGAAVTSTTANGSWMVQAAGCASVRIRASAWTSGIANIKVIDTQALPIRSASTDASGQGIVVGPAASDAPVSGSPILNGGRASTATPTAVSADGDMIALWLDRNGRVIIAGGEAADAAVAGNPVIVGGRGSTATPTAMSADGDATRLWVDLNGRTVVAGQVAHDAAIAGMPVRTGSRAMTADFTGVATGDQCDNVCTVVGAQIVRPFSIPESSWQYAAAASGIANTTTAVVIKAAAAAGIRNYITSLDFFHEALTNATELAVRDGATVIWRTKIQAGAAGRVHLNFPSPLRGTAATLLDVVTLTASGAGAVYFNATGFIAP